MLTMLSHYIIKESKILLHCFIVDSMHANMSGCIAMVQGSGCRSRNLLHHPEDILFPFKRPFSLATDWAMHKTSFLVLPYPTFAHDKELSSFSSSLLMYGFGPGFVPWTTSPKSSHEVCLQSPRTRQQLT